VVGFEAGTPVLVEPSLKYHPYRHGCLTAVRHPDPGQCMVGSLTGARLRKSNGGARWWAQAGRKPAASSARAQARLTARPTGRAETKVGSSDPVVPRGRALAQRIKGTPGPGSNQVKYW